ncbi:response regulator [Novosphingobium album (ex Hu et al. 2023)]|uniref:Response regulator transcription factor n=1 Tax=Novosphingobium album (ex Hu et al. 2023) TaxID=2930093 RepID=A0ABT0B0V1_9SPHN|nr:response regulator transcription factor [Novosphingobium album (ex Hu et al. 2023)]MCJ2178701.1 response regulator transcription factor [Novosphingobium album (ex Hu et al. 2023)]
MSRILVADDHPFFRLGVDAVLKMGGHEVVAMAGNGEAALAALERDDPEIVLLDVRMPDGDGISTLRTMRERGDNRPVIILTVEMTDDQLLAAIRAKVSGIVFKHDAEDRLLKAIDAVNNGRRYIDDELIDKAITLASAVRPPTRLMALSAKEREVAQHVARGLRNREIATLLGTTEGTVKVYLHSIYTKMGLSNRTELAIRLNEAGD